MKVLIVDDEPLARVRLQMLLSAHDEVELLGDASSCESAIVMLQKEMADVLFLDVDMPRRSGFDLLRALGEWRPSVVIFTTAHRQFAPEAFEVGAIDYLVKPFGAERVEMAVERARQHLAKPRTAPSASDSRPNYESMIAVRGRNQIRFVRPSEIIWISAEGNYVRIHTAQGSHLLRDQLKSLESRLDPTRFVRVHRSSIVNLDRVEKLIYDDLGNHTIHLEGGAAVPLGPNYRQSFQEATGARF